MERKNKKVISSIALYLFIGIFVGIIIMPFIWLVLGSIKSMKDLFTVPLQILPSEIKLQNFKDVFEAQPFGKYIMNSLAISIIATMMIVVFGCMGSYALTRTKIKGKKATMIMLLSITLLPPVTLLNPIYLLLSKFSLLNSWMGLALVLTATELPIAIWFLYSFFQNIPFELEEAAMIDGAGILVQITKIILPLVGPGIFTVAIMTFINAWNNFLYAMVFNPLPKGRTVTVALTMFQIDNYLPWNIVSAAAVIVTLPLIIITFILQKRIISGMLEGGVKG